MKPENVVALAFLGVCSAVWVVVTVIDVLTPATAVTPTDDRHAAPAAADTSPDTVSGISPSHTYRPACEHEETAYGLTQVQGNLPIRSEAQIDPHLHTDQGESPRGWPFQAPRSARRVFVVHRVSHGAPHTNGGVEIAELSPLWCEPLRGGYLN